MIARKNHATQTEGIQTATKVQRTHGKTKTERSDANMSSRNGNQATEARKTNRPSIYHYSNTGHNREPRSCAKAYAIRDGKIYVPQKEDSTQIPGESKGIQIDHNKDMVRLPSGADRIIVMRPEQGTPLQFKLPPTAQNQNRCTIRVGMTKHAATCPGSDLTLSVGVLRNVVESAKREKATIRISITTRDKIKNR